MKAISERRFGIEIEHGFHGGCAAVADIIRDLGYNHPVYERTQRDTGKGWRKEVGVWTTHYDGSGVELGTPPLKGEQGLEVIAEVMTELQKHGGWTSNADGMHVHHEALDFMQNKALSAALIETWVDNQGVIEEMVSPMRRGSYGSCPQNMSKNHANELKKKRGNLDLGYMSRGALNMNNVFSFYRNGKQNLEDHHQPTIEIRLHQGTLDAERAIAWVQFGQRLLDGVAARKEPFAVCASVPELLYNLRLPKETREFLVARVREGIDNPSDERAGRKTVQPQDRDESTAPREGGPCPTEGCDATLNRWVECDTCGWYPPEYDEEDDYYDEGYCSCPDCQNADDYY